MAVRLKCAFLSFFVFFLIALPSVASAQLLITGVVDGTNSNGTPKGMEILATEDIADLSVYTIVRDTNGAGPFDTERALPAVALNSGSYYYIAGNTASQTQFNSFGLVPNVNYSILSINGNDILGLALDSDPYNTVFDSFGLESQGDTNFYTDSFAIRNNSSQTGQSPGLLDATNFTITAYSDSGLQGASGLGSFLLVPEPSTVTLATLGLIGFFSLGRVRRQRIVNAPTWRG